MKRTNHVVCALCLAFLSLGLTVPVMGAELTEGLLVHYKFDDRSGTTAQDSSGNGHDGTLVNDPQWVAGKVVGALQFAGNGDYVIDDDAENYLNGLNAVTIAVWIKSELINTDKGFIDGEMPDGNDNTMTMRYDSAGSTGGGDDVLKMAVTSTGGEQQLESSEDLQTTEWQHVALVWSSGQQLQFYVNGALDTPTDNQAALSGTTSVVTELVVGKGSKDDGAAESWQGLIDEVRIYDRALTQEEIQQVMNWSPGANAGKDFRVYGGDKVTLMGGGPPDATSVTWEQSAGTPTVTLTTTANPFVVEFDAPQLQIGTLLTFKLTVDAPSTQGVTTDEVDVIITAINAPKVAPGGLRVMPLDLTAIGSKLGCRLEWEPLIDAEEYEVGLMLGGVWVMALGSYPGAFYETTGMNVGDTRTLGIRGVNKHGTAAEDATAVVGPYEAMRNMARSAGVTPPSAYVYLAAQAPTGMNDELTNASTSSAGYSPEYTTYWGYLWGSPYFFDHIVYYTGDITTNGGWFTDLKVEVTQDGTTWQSVPILDISPAMDFSDQPQGKQDFKRYDIDIPAVRGTGIRINGTPGGPGIDAYQTINGPYTTTAELQVFGDQIRPSDEIAAQGADATFPERGTATLDGSASYSLAGPLVSYQWTGPGGITINNPTAAEASFDAPGVNADTVYVFSLTVSDGTNTDTDDDVRITVTNLVTTAVAGRDWRPVEGMEVVLDGTGSTTTTGNPTYLWTQTAGTDAGVTGAITPTVTFNAPVLWDFMDELTFRLDVNDQGGGASSDEITVTVYNFAGLIFPVGSGYLKEVLHLGDTNIDRITAPMTAAGNDALENWGGRANQNPRPGEPYDFSATGITTTVNPMIWTPEQTDNGWFMWDGRPGEALDEFQQYYHVYIISPAERDVTYRTRNDDECRVFNNGNLVLNRANWDNTLEQGQIALAPSGRGLSKGVNSITMMYEEGAGGNQIALRFTDLAGNEFTDLEYSVGPAYELKNAYGARKLPPVSYETGVPVSVDVEVRVNPAVSLGSATIVENIPAGIPQANVSAPGASVGGGKITWNLTSPNVKTQILTYSVTPPDGMTQSLAFSGTVSFPGDSSAIFGPSVMYPVPTAPRGVEVAMFQDAVVSWNAPLTEGATSYTVYRSVNGGDWELLATTGGTSYVDSSVVTSGNYSYQVSATNVVGDEGPTSRPTTQATPLTQAEVEQGREFREAENFNYGSGQYPGYLSCPAASESPAATNLDPQYDYFHPNIGGPDPPIYRTNDPIPNGIGIETVLDDGTTDVWHTNIGWIDVGSWYRYTFNVTQAGWVDIALRVAAPSSGTMAVYWDEVLIGRTHSFATGTWHNMIYVQLEDRIEATTGEHVVRVESVAGGMNFDKIAIAWNAAPPKRQTIWGDNFDSYAATADVFSPTVGKWTRGVTANNKASWMLWDTEEPNLGSVPTADIAGMEDKYMVSDSDLEQFVPTDEEMLSPEVDCAGWTKLRLNFNKNYRIYPLELDPDRTQDAEVDIRSFDPVSGWSNWTNLLHLDMSDVDVNAEPPELSNPEVFDLSAYDGNKIQLRFHFFHAQYDFWFAVDQIRVSGVQEAVEIPLPDIALAAGNVTISWTSFAGGQYSVEYTANVKGTWTKIAGPFTQTSFTEAMRVDKTGYYRVLGQ